MLTSSYDAGYGLECWDPQVGGNRFHVMPILTPAYPSMNSSMSVNAVTLSVMTEEMAVAHEKTRAILARGGEGWDDLFSASDFPVAHAKYLSAEIYVKGVPEHETEARPCHVHTASMPRPHCAPATPALRPLPRLQCVHATPIFVRSALATLTRTSRPTHPGCSPPPCTHASGEREVSPETFNWPCSAAGPAALVDGLL